MKKIILDFDSTLCSFTTGWIEWMQENLFPTLEYPDLRVLTNKDIASYHWPSEKFGNKAKDFFLKDPFETYRRWVKPIPGSKDFVNHCLERYDVFILTHASCHKTIEAKTEFVEEHFPGIKVKFFDQIEEKYVHLNKRILVDDYPLHCILATAHDKQHSILFNHNNSYGWSNLRDYWDLIWKKKPDLNKIHIATDYEEVKEIIEKVIK